MNQFDSFSGQIFDTITALQGQLDDISLRQTDLAKLITNVHDNSITEQEVADVKVMMERTAAYNAKLLSLRTTMVNMSLKSNQLLKRSNKLKATKLDYLSKVETIRRMEQERDQSIAAKVPSPTTSSPTSCTSSPTTITIPEEIQRTSSFPALPPAISPSASSSSLAVAKKKKKKPKAREVEIGDDGPAWIPKRSVSKKSIG